MRAIYCMSRMCAVISFPKCQAAMLWVLCRGPNAFRIRLQKPGQVVRHLDIWYPQALTRSNAMLGPTYPYIEGKAEHSEEFVSASFSILCWNCSCRFYSRAVRGIRLGCCSDPCEISTGSLGLRDGSYVHISGAPKIMYILALGS